MEQSSVIDLASLSPDNARRTAEEVYDSIRSPQARMVFRGLLRPYFLGLGRRERNNLFAGINLLDRETLEQAQMLGEQIRCKGMALLVISRNVPPSLAADVIESISMAGCIVSTEAVWQVLRGRCRAWFWVGLAKE